MNSATTRLNPEILSILKRLAAARGLSVSEYIRTLIIADLERRKLIPAAVVGDA